MLDLRIGVVADVRRRGDAHPVERGLAVVAVNNFSDLSGIYWARSTHEGGGREVMPDRIAENEPFKV